MTTIEIEEHFETSRVRRLKAATNGQHDRLDESIMEENPFANRERYSLLVKVQYQFHRDVDALYFSPKLSRLLPGLAGLRRFGLIEQDLGDLGVVPATTSDEPEFRRDDADVDLPTALGWLYVAEGSNLGAAFLLKAAGKLGLSESFGARHLAAAPEGPGRHWKTFTAALDAVNLSDAEEERVIPGAHAAFSRVQELVTGLLAQPAATNGTRLSTS
ncbi:biliverdin-producing heme oxygenase [Bradyrhizobium cenepequi]|uniref:biliverdin-producing heme oxygenase n=1 Tax=Bradyrhizobium cenepequi TaxID=2821403 RepID=UPI001CE317B6|nr:biliverdin-producing heme oxygenase [Bradyrhizobium cenepequi]MCA6110820.1 biliverdin-producing heme oxygenase [Bradyrhizobium cenepequi]